MLSASITFLALPNDYIQKADVIIADCSGRNPNVFYELGIAHAHDRKVILITNEAIQDAPADIRHYEFIHYELDKHVEFFEKLDNALNNIFGERYEKLYRQAKAEFESFRQATKAPVELADKDEFVKRVRSAESKEPSMDDALGLAEFVLPKIIANNSDADIMSQITKWLPKKSKTPKPRKRQPKGQPLK